LATGTRPEKEPLVNTTSDQGYWDDIERWDRDYYLHITRSHREFQHVPVVSAEGSYFVLRGGRRILDFASQTVCANLGHRHPMIVDAIKKALDRYTYVSWGFCTDVRAKVAKILIEDILGDEGWAGRIRITSSGGEAMETALALAKLYTGRSNIVSMQYGFFGSTGLTNGGATWVRGWGGALASDDAGTFEPMPGYPLPGHYMIPAPFCYRCPIGHSYPSCKESGRSSTLACVYAAERIIKTIGPETIAAVVVEPVPWTTGFFPPTEYLSEMRGLADRLGVLLVVDEVVTGGGRTGRWFAYQHQAGVFPDIVVMGKGIGGGAIPCGGVIVSKKVDSALVNKRWLTGGTMASHPLTAAAMLGTLQALREDGLVERATQLGEYLGGRLRSMAQKHPSVAFVEGLGLMWVMELVRDRELRLPFVDDDRDAVLAGDATGHPNSVVFSECWENGLLVGGYTPNVIQLTPPLTVTEGECDQAVGILDRALSRIDAMI
jgi:taurine--2-oxoglutarate transaminase